MRPEKQILRERAPPRARRMILLCLASVFMGLLPIADSHSAEYPNRTVRIIIPFSAGGAPDVLMRVVAQGLSEKWGQSVVVENRPGGRTFIGTTAVTKSAPDGYTLLFTADGTFILNPLLYPSLPYSVTELAPITLVATSPHMLAVNKNVPASTVREFIDLAKAKPRTLTYGSTGPGSIQHLAMEFFSRLAGIKLVHVPYKGANETATALLAGEIASTINGVATILPHLSSGVVRALAITTKQRSQLLPAVPTMQEAGVPGFSSQGAFGLLAPKGVPQEIGDKIQRDIMEVVQRPEVQKVLLARGFELSPGGPAEFHKLIDEETEKWRRVITEAKITGE